MNKKDKGKRTCNFAKVQHNNEEPEPSQWSQLPATIMIEIYKNLGDVDRVSSARVCKAWNQVFKMPSLWRSRVLNFGRRRATEGTKAGKDAIKFAKHFTTSLEDIEINLMLFLKPDVKEIVNDFKEFSACLDGARLINISLLYLFVDKVIGQRKKDVIDSTKRLLRNQTSLRKFKTSSPCFDIEGGLEILKCLAEASAATTEHLALYDFFQSGMQIYREERVLTELQKFTALSRIDFDYNVLSVELAKTWVTACPNLSFIGLRADDHVHPMHVISCETWRSLVTAHPNLLVELQASAIPHAKQLIVILSPAIPMFELSWYTFKNTRELEMTILLHRVANYHRTIKHLCLRTSGQFPNLDTIAVQNILSKCTDLLPFNCVSASDNVRARNAWGLVQQTSWLRDSDI